MLTPSIHLACSPPSCLSTVRLYTVLHHPSRHQNYFFVILTCDPYLTLGKIARCIVLDRTFTFPLKKLSDLMIYELWNKSARPVRRHGSTTHLDSVTFVTSRFPPPSHSDTLRSERLSIALSVAQTYCQVLDHVNQGSFWSWCHPPLPKQWLFAPPFSLQVHPLFNLPLLIKFPVRIPFFPLIVTLLPLS